MLEIVNQYWMLMLVGQYPSGPLGGVAATLILSVVSIGFAFPLSVLLALAQLSPFRAIRYPATAIRYLVRSIPLVMLIFGAYFVLPLVLGRPVTGFMTLVYTLIIFEAVYLAEIVRAGIESLPKGQTEASAALGFGYWRRTWYIVLPQALHNMLPSMVGQFVTAIKDTSLGYVISVQEMTYAANQINNNVLTEPFKVFFLLSLVYFVICFSFTQLARYLEKRIARKRAGVPASASKQQAGSFTPSVVSRND